MKRIQPQPFKRIQERWAWEPHFVRCTRANVARAVRRTRNSFGITVRGRPYVRPVVGMAVVMGTSEGMIVKLTHPFGRGVDPQAEILTTEGRTIFGFQTSIAGYELMLP